MMRLCARTLIVSFTLVTGMILILFQSGCQAGGFVRESPFEADRITESFSGDSEESADSGAGRYGDQSKEDQTETGWIYVHVCGCVKKPGLYHLKAGSRVADAVDMAGGFTKKADQTAWNLAQALEDGMQIRVPALGEEASGSASLSASSDGGPDGRAGDKGDKININTASAEELTSLAGIGPSRAEDIVAYRESHGAFKTIEDIKSVSGIGPSIFDKIKDRITVS